MLLKCKRLVIPASLFTALVASASAGDLPFSDDVLDQHLVTQLRTISQSGGADCTPRMQSPCLTPQQPGAGAMPPALSPNTTSPYGTVPSTNSPFTTSPSPFDGQGAAGQSLASAFEGGGVGGPSFGFVPAMMGDGFGVNRNTFVNYEPDAGPTQAKFIVANPSIGGGVGQIKVMEDGSPLIRDRVFFNYSDFLGVQLGPETLQVNRFTFGFEKTFFDGNTSFELRIPTAVTLNESFDHDSGVVSDNFQLGCITMFFKGRLYGNNVCQVTGGLGLTVPTAQDTVLVSSETGLSPHTDAIIKDQAVHLLPWIGGVYTPNDRFFLQWMIEGDFATNKDDVLVEHGEEQPLEPVGGLYDAPFIYGSIGIGYWVIRDSCSWLSGVAQTLELHYNRSLSPTAELTIPTSFAAPPIGTSTIGNRQNLEVTNLTAGINLFLNNEATLTFGYSTPIEGSQASRAFESEFRVMFNWYFGPITRATPIQF